MKRTTRLAASAAAGILAASLSLLYGFSVRAEADQARAEVLAAYGGDLVEVCVATRDIAPGEVLDESSVRTEEWVASLAPEDAARDVAEVAGERTTSSIPARAVICPVYFQDRGGAIEVPRGKVAVSVPSDEERSVGGAIAPGDEVDVYVSEGGIADRLCSAAVIATSDDDDEGTAITWVTLAVDPDRVSEVLAATAKGTVSLTLPGGAAPESAETGSEGDEPADGGGDEAADDESAGGESGGVASGDDGTADGVGDGGNAEGR